MSMIKRERKTLRDSGVYMVIKSKSGWHTHGEHRFTLTGVLNVVVEPSVQTIVESYNLKGKKECIVD